jgi:hypothetical protein
MANEVTIELDGTPYSLNLDDLTGREMGTLDRLRRDYGDSVGSVTGVLLIAKQRAGERVSEAELLDMRVDRWNDATEREAPVPPTPPAAADQREPVTSRR